MIPDKAEFYNSEILKPYQSGHAACELENLGCSSFGEFSI